MQPSKKYAFDVSITFFVTILFGRYLGAVGLVKLYVFAIYR